MQIYKLYSICFDQDAVCGSRSTKTHSPTAHLTFVFAYPLHPLIAMVAQCQAEIAANVRWGTPITE